MDPLELFYRLGVALAIGLLVGTERGWRERKTPAGGRTAGIRTFGLVGFLGGLSGYLHQLTGPILPAILMIVLAAAFILAKWQETEDDHDYSVTSVVAALVVFALGMLALLGDLSTASAGGVAVAAVLAARHSLHGLVRRITWVELRAALTLLVMTLIALPLLPDRAIDRWGALNPFELWLFTVMIAAISFAGYVAIRIAGPRIGILLAGAAGGLVSSTALTLSFGRFSRDAEESARHLSAGAAIAGALSLTRVLVLGSALSFSLLMPLAVSLVPAILVFVAAGFFMLRDDKAKGDIPDLQLKNPFDLSTVLPFGALLGAVAFVTKVLPEYLGTSSLYGIAALSGLVDVDAITLSTARLAGTTVPLATAAEAILIAVAVNVATKAGLAVKAGSQTYGRALGLMSAASLAAGAIGHLVAGRLLA